jgi:hypothetical protein
MRVDDYLFNQGVDFGGLVGVVIGIFFSQLPTVMFGISNEYIHKYANSWNVDSVK